MADQFRMQTVRGVRDIYGDDATCFSHVVETARKKAALYNYQDLLLPIFEFSEIFHRTLGQTSDVVNKETYTFMDRDKTSITLRPEFTAGVVRAVISNGLTQTLPLKFFSYGPLFRHERPQKGRYRQLHQVNFEYIGTAHYMADVEVIKLAHELLTDLGVIGDVTLQLSSIGDSESRNTYTAKLVEYLSRYESDLSEDSKLRLHNNPLRILDTKDERDKQLLEDAPVIYDFFPKEVAERFSNVQNALSNLGVSFELNPLLVRGLDYYTHTVFEFVTSKLGSQGTVLAGGRYDGLFELMGGPNIPSIGFAAGVDRLMSLLNLTPAVKAKLFLVPIGEYAASKVLEIASYLRSNGVTADSVWGGAVSKQLQKASKLGATHALILGEEELSSGMYKIRDLNIGVEETLKLQDIIAKLSHYNQNIK